MHTKLPSLRLAVMICATFVNTHSQHTHYIPNGGARRRGDIMDIGPADGGSAALATTRRTVSWVFLRAFAASS